MFLESVKARSLAARTRAIASQGMHLFGDVILSLHVLMQFSFKHSLQHCFDVVVNILPVAVLSIKFASLSVKT